ncbi:MAG: L-aspartate oxidase [Patescibacteria group bacterium]
MISFDIIVVGSGISGLNFALRAAENKQHVAIVTKKKVANSATNFAQGGIAAVLSELDNFKKHVDDTMIAGCFHNNRRAVQYMVKHGPSAIARLLELGVPFATQNGELMLTREGGHTARRIAFVSDYTGQAIEEVLVAKIRKNSFITLMEHTVAVDLIVKDKNCYGVQILQNRKFKNIYATTTILATGGVGQLYAHTTNPTISTGDGLAMAARASCSFKDLEFIQFHPTALNIKGKPPFLISEAVRGEGAYLRNAKGERFMLKMHKMAELATRDIVARAIFEQEKDGHVYLDLRHKKKEFIKTRFPQIYQKLSKYGLKMEKDLIPISPAAHYSCGGIKVNLKGETGIKNLYAFGEVAGTGVHGANRLASNSLLEALVFSDRILKTTKHPNKKISPTFTTTRFQILSQKNKQILTGLKKKLQQTMWQNVGIVRSQKSLLQAAQLLSEIASSATALPQNNDATIQLRNMIEAAQLITKAALMRKKSLGCHYRVD